jgi:hypothetical protein
MSSVFMRTERQLLSEGTPAMGVVTKCSIVGRGTVYLKYEFRAADGIAIKGSGSYASLQDPGAHIVVLYAPQNPRRNRPYPVPSYRVAQ